MSISTTTTRATNMSEAKPIRVILHCPSVSKLLHMAVYVDQKIDLGYIGTAFGLDPSSLRINGHFIGRGLDLISSYLTWNSLLSFFSAKRLSTGKHHADALIVHGRLSRVGTKRAHDPRDDDAVNGIGGSGRPELEDIVLPYNCKKMREADSGKNGDFCGTPMLSKGLGFKRKQLLEDLSLLKKLRINETCSDIPEKGNDFSKSISSNRLRCSPMNPNMKRTRENDVDEAIMAAPYKKIR